MVLVRAQERCWIGKRGPWACVCQTEGSGLLLRMPSVKADFCSSHRYVCVCMCVYLYVRVWVCVCVLHKAYGCVHMCGGQIRISGVSCSLTCWRHGLSLNWKSVWLDWLAGKPLGSTCLHLPMLCLQACSDMPSFLNGCLGFKPRSSEPSHTWSHFWSPTAFKLNTVVCHWVVRRCIKATYCGFLMSLWVKQPCAWCLVRRTL